MMDILGITPIIRDMFESGLYVNRHRRGEFANDRERWFTAAFECGIVGDDGIEKCWKLYVKSLYLTD
tara:strand:+ start:97 stop:297 length:201 start_codon:yes stop_codon:yes gene_type:complete